MTRIAALTAFWALIGVIAFVTLCPIQYRPVTGHVVSERFGAFLLLGLALRLATPRRSLAAVGVVGLIAGGLEAAQALVPGRHGHLIDAMEKFAGGVSGVILASLLIAWNAHGPAMARSDPERP
jgi:VanZ family protein